MIGKVMGETKQKTATVCIVWLLP